MSLTTEKLTRGATEQLFVRCPIGTKDRLEEFRRTNGFRSASEAVRVLIDRGLVELDS